MMRKCNRFLALAISAILLLTGCGATKEKLTGETASEGVAAATDMNDKETVRVLVPGLSEESTIDPVSGLETKSLSQFQEFLNEKIPDYNIELKTVAWDGWIQSLEAMIAAKEIDVGFFTNQEAVPEWYEDLTPYLQADDTVNLDTMKDFFIAPALHYSTYKSFNYPEESGKIFGLPVTMAGFMITYDSQLFKEWGVGEPDSDMNMSDLVALAEKMTGVNPVTGKTNYGAYFSSERTEWYALSYDAVKPYFSDTMDINNLDTEEYVEYIKTSSEVKTFFGDMIRLVNCANSAITTGDGDENWLTENNDIAINFDMKEGPKQYMRYVVAGDESIINRYKTLMVPSGVVGQSFPEFYKFSVVKSANNKDAAWNVVKAMSTDKEIVDFYISSYQPDKVSCLCDTESMSIMEYDINKERHDYQMNHMLMTDDYWYWRTPLQPVINQIISKEYNEEQAVEAFYEGVSTWVGNIKQQSGK